MVATIRSRLVEVMAIAESQSRVITTSQLASCGISAKAAAELEAEGLLRRIRRGAYAVAGRLATPFEETVAAALLIGPQGAASHRTAAAIHKLPGLLPPTLPELSVPRAYRNKLAGTRIHRVAHLGECDVEQRYGIRVTVPSRTLVDIAGSLNDYRLARLIDEGMIEKRWSIEGLVECLQRSAPGGRPGSRRLHDLLVVRLAEPRADSTLALRVVRALAPFAPFETEYQLVLGGHVVILDVAWPRWRVVAEVDGWEGRSRSRGKFDWDRRRGNLLAANGWTVTHLTSAMSDDEMRRDVGLLLPPFAAQFRSA